MLKKIQKLLDSGKPGSAEEAERLLIQEADGGNGEAALALVELYLEYYSPDERGQEAVRWLEFAGQKGVAHAAFYLWRLYEGTPYSVIADLQEKFAQDEKKAQHWRNRALELAHPEALLWKARDLLKTGQTDQTLALIDRILDLRTQDEEFREALLAAQADATELKNEIHERAERASKVSKTMQSLEKAKPAELHNAAIAMINDAPEGVVPPEAIQMLEIAASKGLDPSRRMLLKIKKVR